jgi:hypothetical protein
VLIKTVRKQYVSDSLLNVQDVLLGFGHKERMQTIRGRKVNTSELNDAII